MKHVLITNDFPPKVGGIQSYLWELWRRLPADDFVVFTSAYEGAENFDAAQPFRVVRSSKSWLLPTPGLIRELKQLIHEVDAAFVFIDPPLPLGLIGPHLGVPYMLLAHGAETVIPGRLPYTSVLMSRVAKHSLGLIGSSDYIAGVTKQWSTLRDKQVVSIPPGVDVHRFVPTTSQNKLATREKFGLPVDRPVVVSVSRLVKRKGFDRVIEAVDSLGRKYPGITLAIVGKGRDEPRLRKIAEQASVNVVFLGRVSDQDLPSIHGCADVFVMACHDRWFGLEREGFGIVFVDASATARPIVVGQSGGSHETVVEGETGFLVPAPVKPTGIAEALDRVLGDPQKATEMGLAGRERAVSTFSYDALVERLKETIKALPLG